MGGIRAKLRLGTVVLLPIRDTLFRETLSTYTYNFAELHSALKASVGEVRASRYHLTLGSVDACLSAHCSLSKSLRHVSRSASLWMPLNIVVDLVD